MVGRNYVANTEQESLYLARVTRTVQHRPYDYQTRTYGPTEERTGVSYYGPYNTKQAAANVGSGKARSWGTVLEARVEILETKLDWTVVRDTMVIERNNKED